MSNQKKKKSTTNTEQSTAQKKTRKQPQKQERKKHYTKEDYRMKKRHYTIGAIFCLLACVLALSTQTDGKYTWETLQAGVYALLGISGLFLKSGAKYEENATRAKALDLIGLIFVALCLGMVFSLLTT